MMASASDWNSTPRLKQRVCPDHHQIPALGTGREAGPALGGALATGDEADIDAEWRQPEAQGLVMLLGEYLRRRHDRGLAAVFGGANGRESGDDGLSRAYVALQQAHHRTTCVQVVQHLRSDPRLGPRQAEAEVAQQLAAELPVRWQGQGRLGLRHRLTMLQHQVVADEFVEGHARPRGLDSRFRAGFRVRPM